MVSDLAGKRAVLNVLALEYPVCTGGLGINIYSVAYPFILQVIRQVLYISTLCSIKETNLEEKKLNSKSIKASKLQISWRVSPRMV